MFASSDSISLSLSVWIKGPEHFRTFDHRFNDVSRPYLCSKLYISRCLSPLYISFTLGFLNASQEIVLLSMTISKVTKPLSGRTLVGSIHIGVRSPRRWDIWDAIHLHPKVQFNHITFSRWICVTYLDLYITWASIP